MQDKDFKNLKMQCGICGSALLKKRDVQVDHDHATGKARGILCRSCNTGLGHFKDSPSLLRRAATYLSNSRRTEGSTAGKDGFTAEQTMRITGLTAEELASVVRNDAVFSWFSPKDACLLYDKVKVRQWCHSHAAEIQIRKETNRINATLRLSRPSS